MIVEDETDLIDILQIWIEEIGFKTQTSENGFDALNKINRQKPDLVLLDISLPQLNGFEVLKKLRSNPETAHIPVIILTANCDLETKKNALALKADGFMTKPVEASDLSKMIQKFITPSGNS